MDVPTPLNDQQDEHIPTHIIVIGKYISYLKLALFTSSIEWEIFTVNIFMVHDCNVLEK